MAEQYDDIVIGSGQSGGPLSTALAGTKRRVALIEREHVGGTCINEGCTPTKTMVASARVAYLTRRGADYGVHSDNLRIDMPRVRQRKRDIVDSFRSGSERRIQSTPGLDSIRGEARFVGPKTIEVNGAQLEADLFFLNVGAESSLVIVKDAADIGADGESRRHRQSGIGHFGQAGALAAERIFHVAFTFGFSASKKVNVFLHCILLN